jgi:hypothetical protein
MSSCRTMSHSLAYPTSPILSNNVCDRKDVCAVCNYSLYNAQWLLGTIRKNISRSSLEKKSLHAPILPSFGVGPTSSFVTLKDNGFLPIKLPILIIVSYCYGGLLNIFRHFCPCLLICDISKATLNEPIISRNIFAVFSASIPALWCAPSNVMPSRLIAFSRP